MIKEFFKTILYEPFYNLLVFFAWLIPGHSVGWSILLLTLLVKVILWVPQAKALQSPLQMRAYQDEIKEIQDRYKDDRTAQGQAVLAFYKEKGINPLSGCLPLLIQLPVIFILYQVFLVGVGDIRLDLLYPFTPHLDTINPLFLGINMAEPDRWILPTIAAIAQFLQAKHYASLQPQSARKDDPSAIMSKQMIYLFPVMTFIIGRSLPAGLALYWTATTFFQFFQQWYVFKMYKVEKPKVQVSVRQKSVSKKKSKRSR